VATAVFHSIVLQYLSEDERQHLQEVIREAAERATSSAPLAWLHMEPAGEHADVRLTLWPDGTERLLARAGYHGEIVHWLASHERHSQPKVGEVDISAGDA
jgi:hypothetical protein